MTQIGNHTPNAQEVCFGTFEFRKFEFVSDLEFLISSFRTLLSRFNTMKFKHSQSQTMFATTKKEVRHA